MKKEIDDKAIIKKITGGYTFVSIIVILGVFIAFIGFIISNSFTFILVGFIISFVLMIIHKVGANKKSKLDNWYFSREIVTSVVYFNDEYGKEYYVELFDNKRVHITDYDLCYGDVIYVLRYKKNDTPGYYFDDKTTHYSGLLSIVDNTNHYTDVEYTWRNGNSFHKTLNPVTPSTHEVENGLFKVVAAPKKLSPKEARKRIIMMIVVLLLWVVYPIFYDRKNNTENNWIKTDAEIIDVVQISHSDETYSYQYTILYTYGNQKFENVINRYDTYDSLCEKTEIEKHMTIYVNTHMPSAIKVLDWEKCTYR